MCKRRLCLHRHLESVIVLVWGLAKFQHDREHIVPKVFGRADIVSLDTITQSKAVVHAPVDKFVKAWQKGKVAPVHLRVETKSGSLYKGYLR